MNSVSLIGSVSRRAGGLFESVRRLHQELISNSEGPANTRTGSPADPNGKISARVLGLRDEFTPLDVNAWQPVPVRQFRVLGPRCFGFAPGLLGDLKNSRPDLVHVHGLWQYISLAAVLWRRRSGRPHLVSPHGMLDSWALKHSACKKRCSWALYEERHLRGAACIRALCEAELGSIRALGLRNPVCIVPNGIDLVDLNQRSDAAGPYTESSTKVLLYLGRIHPKKGLALLLRAWAQNLRRNDWLLAIAGWDQAGHEAQLKGLATQLGLQWSDTLHAFPRKPSVLFLGPQFGPAKERLLRRCDAVILPSRSEGLPMAILEAWARAKPALLTPQCNLPEGRLAGAGIQIEPDVDSIGAGLQRIFQSERGELSSMGLRGRRLVAEKFAWPKIAADLTGVYRWLVDRDPMPECVSLS